MDAARTIAHALKGLKADSLAERSNDNALHKGVLHENTRFLAVWTAWEPNAFDGQDSSFSGGSGHDATGRYVPSWSRGSDGTLHNEPLVDYEKPGVGDFYLLANQC